MNSSKSFKLKVPLDVIQVNMAEYWVLKREDGAWLGNISKTQISVAFLKWISLVLTMGECKIN